MSEIHLLFAIESPLSDLFFYRSWSFEKESFTRNDRVKNQRNERPVPTADPAPGHFLLAAHHWR